jgi:hypothetical protein
VLLGGAGSAGVGGGGAVSGFVSAGGAGVGGWSSAGGAVGLGAGRGAFLRFTVFLLTSSLSSSSSRATFSPTYRLSRIADKALMAMQRFVSCVLVLLGMLWRYVAM